MKQYRRQLRESATIRTLLNHAANEGVKVRNGIVIENETIFLEPVNSSADSEYVYGNEENKHLITVGDKRAVQYLPKFIISFLFQCLQLRQQSIIDFKKMIFTLNGLQTIELLDRAIDIVSNNKSIDFTKSVIFILGNLDEAYTMSSTFNPDINADKFHETSEKINTNHIKRALKKKFRNKQISRQGNNHIIYPAFNEDNFKILGLATIKGAISKVIQNF